MFDEEQVDEDENLDSEEQEDEEEEKGTPPDEESEVLKKQVEELEGSKTGLEKQVDDLNSRLTSPEYIEYLNSKRQGKEEKPPKAEDDEHEDLDMLSSTELAARIKGMSRADLKEVKDSVAGEFGQLKAGIARKMAAVDLQLAVIKHPELDDALNDKKSQELLQGIANGNPGWNMEQVFRQFKLEKMASDKEQEEQNDAKKKRELDVEFEKGSLPSGLKEHKDLSPEEAGNLAWKKAFGK